MPGQDRTSHSSAQGTAPGHTSYRLSQRTTPTIVSSIRSKPGDLVSTTRLPDCEERGNLFPMPYGDGLYRPAYRRSDGSLQPVAGTRAMTMSQVGATITQHNDELRWRRDGIDD